MDQLCAYSDHPSVPLLQAPKPLESSSPTTNCSVCGYLLRFSRIVLSAGLLEEESTNQSIPASFIPLYPTSPEIIAAALRFPAATHLLLGGYTQFYGL
ncbi:hypothetical protein MSAN_02302800 [Mycena sanguinolenta]|uniref:Uncharacterized protein n=1 Tax=Mycena sanguinolenta TaxID=230812 RepID=A0A8H6X9K3_9AGAR|nr:hypothetical protein MSAN_02302800 [Mycena sanguinolenta]